MLVVEPFQCDISIELSQTYIFSPRIHKNEIQKQNEAIDFRLMKSLKSIFKQY